MDADSFHDLALRIMAGEATPEDRAALEGALAEDPSRRVDLQEFEMVHDLLRTTAPMLACADASETPLPAHRVNELRTAVRQHFGPVTSRRKSWPGLNILRWFLAGGGLAGLALLILLLSFANRTVEVGQYSNDRVRGEQGLSAQDVPTAQVLNFDQDAPFDTWQDQPLAWNQHAKIWVDNERDLLHIVRRIGHGNVVSEDKPLAPTTEGQRAQIQQAVQDVSN